MEEVKKLLAECTCCDDVDDVVEGHTALMKAARGNGHGEGPFAEMLEIIWKTYKKLKGNLGRVLSRRLRCRGRNWSILMHGCKCGNKRNLEIIFGFYQQEYGDNLGHLQDHIDLVDVDCKVKEFVAQKIGLGSLTVVSNYAKRSRRGRAPSATPAATAAAAAAAATKKRSHDSDRNHDAKDSKKKRSSLKKVPPESKLADDESKEEDGKFPAREQVPVKHEPNDGMVNEEEEAAALPAPADDTAAHNVISIDEDEGNEGNGVAPDAAPSSAPVAAATVSVPPTRRGLRQSLLVLEEEFGITNHSGTILDRLARLEQTMSGPVRASIPCETIINDLWRKVYN